MKRTDKFSQPITMTFNKPNEAEMQELIVLSKGEKAVIKKYLEGKIEMFGTSDEDMEQMSKVLHKADDLRRKMKADDGNDMVKWFWEMYRQQQGIK
jgi:hypothetical protein